MTSSYLNPGESLTEAVAGLIMVLSITLAQTHRDGYNFCPSSRVMQSPRGRFAREQPLRSIQAILGADEVDLTIGRK
jgi:hypothetical protein